MKFLAFLVGLFVLGYIGLHVTPAGRRSLARMREEAALSAQKEAASSAPAPSQAQAPAPPAPTEADRIVENAEQPLLLVFWQPHCPECERMDPIVTAFEQHHLGYRVLRINTRLAENRNLSDKFAIRGTPTFIVTRSGATLRRNDGGFWKLEEFERFVRPGDPF